MKNIIKIKENLSGNVKELLEEQLLYVDKLSLLLDTCTNIMNLQSICNSIESLNEELLKQQLPEDLKSELINLNIIISLILNNGGIEYGN